jgi:hypothetical protein
MRSLRCQRLCRILVATLSRCSTGWCAIRNTGVTAHRNLAADQSRNTACSSDRNLARNTPCASCHASLAYLAAGCVRNLASAGLLDHSAVGVRDLFGDTLRHHTALGVRNLFGHTMVCPGAGCVRDSFGATFFNHGASGVRDLLGASLRCERASRVRNSFCAGLWDLFAHSIRYLLMADLWHHASTLNLLFDYFRTPDAAGYRTTGTLNLSRTGTTRIAGIRNRLLVYAARNVSCYCLPLSGADIDTACFRHRLTDRVTDVPVAGLSFCFVGCVANVAVAGLVAGLADFIADCSVAGLVARLANRVTNVSIACFVRRLANIAAYRAIARFHHRLGDSLLHATVLGFIDRLANRVAFVSVAGVVHVSSALNRNLFGALFVYRLHARVLLLFHHNFSHRAVLWSTITFCGSEITTIVAGLGRAVRKSSSSAQSSCYKTTAEQYANCSNCSNHEPSHRLVPRHCVSDIIGESLTDDSSSA